MYLTVLLLLLLITNAFVAIAGLSWRNTASPTFKHAWETKHRKSHWLPTCSPFDSFSTHPSTVELGLSKSNENESDLYTDEIESGYNQGLVVLATVPMAWGTFEPAVRLVYKYEPLMPPLVFSFAYFFVATLVLTIGSLSWSALSPSTPVAGSKGQEAFNNESSELAMRGGLELGTYLFVGNAFQVIGLTTVPSDRAAFLLQLTTIFVPLLKRATGDYLLSFPTWIACLVALMGVALIGLDNGDYNILNDVFLSHNDVLHQSTRILDRLPVFSVDDGYIILAAVFYTFHCIRLETYARSSTSAIGLATVKATTEMIWSGLVILGCIGVALAPSDNLAVLDMARTSGEKLLAYGEYIRQQISSGLFWVSEQWPTVGLATLWVGAVTVAYTIYAQSFGQSKVSAVTANLIYSSQPIFTALVAYFLLGETLGPNGYIGGTLIGVAVLLVIAVETETEERHSSRRN